MKKILLLAVASTLSVGVWANASYKATTECQFDYDDFNYCSKANIVKYKNALQTQKPNFSSKYILLNMGGKNYFQYVAIDSKNGLVFPLRDAISGFKNKQGGYNGKPPIINYSVNNTYLCVQGSLDAYRDAYDNVKICYSIQDDEYSKYKKTFRRVGTPESLDY